MNPDATDSFMGNDQAELELLHELTSGTGLASPPPPAGFQQPGQQTGVPGANFQNSGTASFQPTAGGQGYQQPGHLDLPDTNEGLVGRLDDNLWKQILNDYEDVIVDGPPLPANSTNDPESPYINQWNKIDDLRQNGGALVKIELDRIWIESSDSLFNLTLRKNFAPVIERMRWDLVNPHDNEPGGPNLRLAEALKRRLYDEVKNKLQDFQGNEEMRYRLERWNNGLVDFGSSALNIVQPIQTVLERERAIIEHTRNQSQEESQDMQNHSLQPDTHLAWISAISTELSDLERVSQNACEQVQDLIPQVQQLQVQLQGQLHRIDTIDRGALSPQELEGLNGIVQRRDLVRQNEKTVLEQCYWPSVEQLRSLLSKVLDDGIKEYQRNAAYIECGKLTSHYLALDQLQGWVKRLAKLISINLQQMDKLLFLEQQLGLSTQPQQTNGATSLRVIQQLIPNYSIMIEQIVQKGLIVEKHPPQILMKDRRFQCQLRHLVGDALDIHKLGFRVRVYLINGENAMKVLHDGATSQFSKSGEIINDKATSDFISSSGVLSVSMRTMCLKMQQRGAQRSSEMVAELKFAMLYRTEITVRCLSQQTTVHAQALSLPIVVISHGKQEADAQATIFWDNAFAHVNRRPFEVEESVQWSAMLDALDARWKFACREGNVAVGLMPQARQYLSMKLFNQQEIEPGTMISWRRFNHDKMCGVSEQRREHQFTFWTWFYKAMELCNCKYVRKYWNCGYIHGFLSKADCQEMLLREARGRQAGIFIFRFSESQLGAISVSCTVKDETDHIQVHNLSPDTVTEFKVVSLPDMVRDLKYLQYLYPNVYNPSLIHKDQAFGSDYTNAILCPAPGDGYIRKQFVVSTETGSTNQHQQNAMNLEHGPESPAAPGHPLAALRDDHSMDEDG